MNHFIDKIPEMVVDYVKSITELKKLNIKVVKPRKTKHGDFRERNSNYTITTVSYTHLTLPTMDSV